MKVLRPNFEKGGGLIAAVAQDVKTLEIRMLGFANEEAVKQSLATGLATFYSRSKNRVWVKGESSRNTLWLVAPPRIYCDGDAIIYLVEAVGPTCHTGQAGCFYRSILDVDKAVFPLQEAALPIVDWEVNL